MNCKISTKKHLKAQRGEGSPLTNGVKFSLFGGVQTEVSPFLEISTCLAERKESVRRLRLTSVRSVVVVTVRRRKSAS